MKLRNLIPRKGKVKEGCKFDKTSNTFSCESRRIHEDGGEEELGVIAGSLNAQCEVVVDEVFENEQGVIDRLDDKFVKKIRSKCKARPTDY